jgi:hypothetical protein
MNDIFKIPNKIFRFFFPKDFMGELRRGMGIGEKKGKERLKVLEERRNKKRGKK